MVLTKTEAEARRTCDAGLANYLSNRHSVHINRSLAYGVIGGIVPTSALFLISAFFSSLVKNRSKKPNDIVIKLQSKNVLM